MYVWTIETNPFYTRGLQNKYGEKSLKRELARIRTLLGEKTGTWMSALVLQNDASGTVKLNDQNWET